MAILAMSSKPLQAPGGRREGGREGGREGEREGRKKFKGYFEALLTAGKSVWNHAQ